MGELPSSHAFEDIEHLENKYPQNRHVSEIALTQETSQDSLQLPVLLHSRQIPLPDHPRYDAGILFVDCLEATAHDRLS